MVDLVQGRIEKQVRAKVRRLALTLDEAGDLMELAYKLAERADYTSSPRDLAALSRELRDTLQALEKAADERPEQEGDGVDHLAARRSRRAATA